jgi:hypothetical protein
MEILLLLIFLIAVLAFALSKAFEKPEFKTTRYPSIKD